MSSAIINTEIDSLITTLLSDNIIYLNEYMLLIKLHLNKYFKKWLNDKNIYPKYKNYHSKNNKYYNNILGIDGESIPNPNITITMIPNNINIINFVCCKTNTRSLKDIYFNSDLSSGFCINGSYFMLEDHVTTRKYGISNIDAIGKPISYYKYNTQNDGTPKIDLNEIGLLEPFNPPSKINLNLKHSLNWVNDTLGILIINDKKISITTKNDFIIKKSTLNANAQFLTGNLLMNNSEIVMKEELILIVYNLNKIGPMVNGITLNEFTKCILCKQNGIPLTINEIITLKLNQEVFLKNDLNQIFLSRYNTENLFFPYNASLYNLEYNGNFAGLIPPAMPTHASDLNPRTCIFIDENEHVFFMNVEGRKSDAGDFGGVGLDLFQLAMICKSMGAVYAINLDGGGSSIMGWKEHASLYDSVGNKDYSLGNAIVVLPP
jgi:hypothetical protein